MNVKFLFLLLISQISNEKSDLDFGLLGGKKSLSCSNDLGKMDFLADFSFSSIEAIKSYFLLRFKDSSDKNHFSICLIEPYGEEGTSILDYRIKDYIKNMIYKYDDRLKKIFESELIKNILGNLTNIINYNIVIQSRNIKKFIEEKILPKLNITSNILLKLMEGESISQILYDLNKTELMDKFNASMCSFKQKIVKIISEDPYFFQIYNIPKMLDDLSAFILEENNTVKYEIMVDNLDTSLTGFNYITIRLLEKIKNAFKDNINSTNLKDIVDEVKAKIEKEMIVLEEQFLNISGTLKDKVNQSYLSNLKNVINDTIYNLPNILQEKIDKKEPLIIFDELFIYFNYSNGKINNTIPSLIYSLKNYTNNTSINNIPLMLIKILGESANEIKAKIYELNIPLLTETTKTIDSLNNAIIERIKSINTSEIFGFIKVINSEIKSLIGLYRNDFRKVFNISKENFLYFLGEVNILNNKKIAEALKEQIEIFFRAINTLKNETKSLYKNGLNITGILTKYINIDNDFIQVIEKVKENNRNINSIFKTSLEFIQLSEDIEKAKEIINDYEIVYQKKFNQTLYNFADKVEKYNSTLAKEKVSSLIDKFLTKLNKLSNFLNRTEFNLNTIVLKIRELIEYNLNSINITKFAKIYNKCLSKIVETKKEIITLLEKKNITLSGIRDKINSIADDITEREKLYNLLSLIKNNYELIFGYVQNKTNNFHKEELLNIIENTTYYNAIKPYINQIKEKNDELKAKLNDTQIVEWIQKIKYLLKNRTELMEVINSKLSEIDLEESIAKLNMSLTKNKNELIQELKNVTKMKKINNELIENIEKIKHIDIIQKINSTFIVKLILDKIQNSKDYYQALKKTINISAITHTTKLDEIISNLRKDLREQIAQVPLVLKKLYIKMNESLYTCEKAFISRKDPDFSDIFKSIEEVHHKLNYSKVGDVPKILYDFIVQLNQKLMKKTNIMSLSTNENFIALKKELNSSFIKLKAQMEKSEDTRQLLSELNNIKNILNNITYTINSLSVVKSLINFANTTFQIITNTKIYDIKRFFQKIHAILFEEMKNLKQYEKTSQKISYIINKYYYQNEKVQSIVEKLFNTTRINDKIKYFISIVEKIENSYELMQSPKGPEIYNKSKGFLKQTINNNSTNILLGITEELIQEINDLMTLVDLIHKKFQSFINTNYGSYHAQRRIEDTNNNPQLKQILDSIKEKFDSLGINFDFNSETFEKIKEGLRNVQNQIKNFTKSLVGKNLTIVINELKEKITTKIKGLVSENFFKAFSYEKTLDYIRIRNRIDNLILKIIDFIKNLDAKIHSEDLNLDNIIKKINTDLFNDKMTNITLALKGIMLVLTDTPELSRFYKNITSLIHQLIDSILKLPRILRNIRNNRISQVESIKNNNRRRRMMDEIGHLRCKLDDVFSNDEELIAEPGNINRFILESNKDYNIDIKNKIYLEIDKDLSEKCKNNKIIYYLAESLYYNSIYNLKIEPEKKRFVYNIGIGMLPTITIPNFFYIIIKVKMYLTKKNSRFSTIEEDVDTYCLLEDNSYLHDAVFTCYGYSDSIDQNSEITLGNFTSEYIEDLPDDITDKNITDENLIFAKSKSSGINSKVIIGIVIAIVGFLAIVTIIIVKCLRKKKNNPAVYNIENSVNQLQVQTKTN